MARTKSLKDQICDWSPDAANAFRDAGIENDVDFQALTREDLHELLPGRKQFKIRKEIMEMISKSKEARTKSLKDQICDRSPAAADAFLDAGIRNDIDIQALTREDLNELLPGNKQFPVRKEIMEMISKSKQDTAKDIDLIMKEIRGFLPTHIMESSISSEGVLHGYIHLLRNLEEQHTTARDFIHKHIKLLDSDTKEEPMEEVPITQSDNADAEIQTKRKKTDKISTAEKYGRNPNETLNGTSYTDGGNTEPKKEEEGKKSANGENSLESRKSKTKLHKPGGNCQAKQEKENSSFKGFLSAGLLNTYSNIMVKPVKFHPIICGQTLDTHKTLLKQVDEQGMGIKLEKTILQNCQVIMVFCPITSRVGTDIEAAMRTIPAGKDAILVVMHHTFNPDYVTSRRVASQYNNIKEEVHVLFHDSVGLLSCETNKKAVSVIHKALKRYSEDPMQQQGP